MQLRYYKILSYVAIGLGIWRGVHGDHLDFLEMMAVAFFLEIKNDLQTFKEEFENLKEEIIWKKSKLK